MHEETIESIAPDLLNEQGWRSLANIRLRRLEEVNAENERLRGALRWGIGAALNEMTVRNLPLEWSPESGIGRMMAALGIFETKMTPAIRKWLE